MKYRIITRPKKESGFLFWKVVTYGEWEYYIQVTPSSDKDKIKRYVDMLNQKESDHDFSFISYEPLDIDLEITLPILGMLNRDAYSYTVTKS